MKVFMFNDGYNGSKACFIPANSAIGAAKIYNRITGEQEHQEAFTEVSDTKTGRLSEVEIHY